MTNLLKYTIYMNKRIKSSLDVIHILSKDSLEKTFWNLWKKNIKKNNKVYLDDDYEFMCVKTKFHKK